MVSLKKMQTEIFFRKAKSYREMFGYALPVIAKVQVKHMVGLDWYIHWIDATDKEDCLYVNLKSKKEALKIVQANNQWQLIENIE